MNTTLTLIGRSLLRGSVLAAVGCVLIFVVFTVWSFVDESGKRSTTHGMTSIKSSGNQIEEGVHS